VIFLEAKGLDVAEKNRCSFQFYSMSQCSPIVVTSAFPEIKNGNKFADRRDKFGTLPVETASGV